MCAAKCLMEAKVFAQSIPHRRQRTALAQECEFSYCFPYFFNIPYSFSSCPTGQRDLLMPWVSVSLETRSCAHNFPCVSLQVITTPSAVPAASLVVGFPNQNDLSELLFNLEFSRHCLKQDLPEWAARRGGGDGWVLSSALGELIKGFVFPQDPRGSG